MAAESKGTQRCRLQSWQSSHLACGPTFHQAVVPSKTTLKAPQPRRGGSQWLSLMALLFRVWPGASPLT